VFFWRKIVWNILALKKESEGASEKGRSCTKQKDKKEVYLWSCLRISSYVSLISSTEASSSSVEVSPNGAPMRTALSSRRIILPLRVFGSLLTITMASGVAIGPIVFLMCLIRSARSSSEGVKPVRSVTKATGTSPFTASSLPMTAASETAGCETSALSSSTVPMRCPATLSTSSALPSSHK
jgi:hypothetical protein